MRYITATVVKDNNEKRKLSTTIIQSTTNQDGDVYIKTTSIERLDKLAYTFYGDASLWWILATENALGKGTLIVPADTRMRIPNPDTIQQYINNISNTNNSR